MHDIFRRFDEDKSGQLDSGEFGKLLSAIVDTGPLPDDTVRFLLSAFDADGNGIISFEELERAWLSWFGEASKPDGAAVVPVINKLRSSVPFDAVAISLDWHPHEHCSFHEVVTAGQSPAPLHPSQA